MLLNVTDLTAGYRHQRPILRQINLTIRHGEFWAILAPNGAGKTTLLKTLAGVLPPLGGRLELIGCDMRNIERRALAKQIAVVSADVPRSEYTVEQMIMLGRLPHQKPLQASTRYDRELVDDALEIVGLSAKKKRRCRELSQGERQKTAIARALAQQPQLLLLDEPTAHLDLYNQAAMLQLIRRLTEHRRLAAAAVLHDVNLSLQFCSHLLVLHDGVCTAQGPAEGLLSAELLHQMYGLHFEVRRDETGSYVRTISEVL